MLSVTALSGFGGGSGTATATFREADFSNTDLTEYTFSGKSIGTAADDRFVVVVAMGRQTSSRTIDSCTVDGQATTRVTYIAGEVHGAIFITTSPVTAGTTADVVVTCSAGTARLGIGVYSMTGGATTLADTIAILEDDPSDTIDVPAQGCIIAGGFSISGSTTTWTGVDEDSDQTIEGPNVMTTGSINLAEGESGRTVSLSFSASSGDTLVAASWGP